MKKLITILSFIAGVGLFAQAPNMFKYQAVARDNSGAVLADQTVSFEISILQNSSGGTPVYKETHVATTNQHGLASLNIGGGAVTLGDFSTIDWGAALYFIQVKMDPAGGSAYVMMGTSQLLSVPYALDAQVAEAVDWSDISNVPSDIADGDDNSGGTPAWSTLTGIPAGFADNTDNDVLSGLTCSINQIALYNGSSWVCQTYYPTTGQFSASVFGTAQAVALISTTSYTLIPGLTQTITVPSNCRVIISTDGGVQCSAGGVAFAAVDIGIHVDGTASPQGGQQQIIASNTDAVGQMISYWSMTKTYTLSAGAHTIEVRYRDSGAGTADGNVSGTNPLIQGTLTVTIINL
ncbi:MAG: hypothetical protein IPM74_02805 [Crocinitomicaceae bacterium]|nr:hypothetical protein [Crocinitomicaceae bacterium]MBK8924846.1 hypothetical protein [Crocinitomicaceae bacterium]